MFKFSFRETVKATQVTAGKKKTRKKKRTCRIKIKESSWGERG